eukprot:scaffold112010_cov69-Phaeocystis_antarctica.AAC.1
MQPRPGEGSGLGSVVRVRVRVRVRVLGFGLTHAAAEVARGAEGLDARAHGEGRLAVDLDELLHAALRRERRVRLGRAHGRREDDQVVRRLGRGGEPPAAGRDGAVGRDGPGDVELARLAPAALVRIEQDACAVVRHREARRLRRGGRGG